MADQIIVGIDIGTSKIATAIAKISEEEMPRILGFSSVESRGVKKGQIVDINQVSTALEECVEKAERMAGAKISQAYVSVGGPHIDSINSHGVVAIAQPEVEISQEDVDRAVEAAKAISISSTREVIDVTPREYIVDGQAGIKNPLGMSGVRLEVNTHIITAGSTNLRNLDRSLTDLGIERLGFVFSGLASSLSTLSETERELGVALVDIGGGKTDICIFIEGALSYSSSIPIGARHITNDIAVGTRVSLQSAEKIKLFLADYNDEKKKDELDISKLRLVEGISAISSKVVVDGIIKPRVEEIFEYVYQEIEKSGFATQIPSGIVATGGGALTIGLVDSARRVIGAAARLGVPKDIAGLADELLYPQYSTLAGLFIHGKANIMHKRKINIKDFDKIFRNFSFKSSFKKVSDLFKSFVP